jgi:hypothetical protein
MQLRQTRVAPDIVQFRQDNLAKLSWPSILGIMSDGDADPRYLRALAHPLRWRLLDLIRTEGTVTVTRCAVVLGESTASCSYHLSMLAKYGYIAPAPGEGREKPWQMARREGPLSLEPRGPGFEEALASEAAMAAFLGHEAAQLRDFFLRRREIEPAEWQRKWMLASQVTWLTPDQVREFGARLGQLLTEIAERGDEANRNPGARPVRLFIAVTPEPATPGADTPPGVREHAKLRQAGGAPNDNDR